MSRGQLVVRLIKGVMPALLLVFAVLCSIMAGVAAPTEAAAIGALGGLLIVGLSGKLSKKVLRDTCMDTLTTSAMIFFVIMTAQAFSLAFRGLGGERLIQDLFTLIPGGTTTDILFFMGVLFLAGVLLEWAEISYIVLPLFLPYFVAQGVDMVWLAASCPTARWEVRVSRKRRPQCSRVMRVLGSPCNRPSPRRDGCWAALGATSAPPSNSRAALTRP